VALPLIARGAKSAVLVTYDDIADAFAADDAERFASP
jgi:hypothetical protein